MSKLRPIAIYLPQYHPIPENDAWWGKGFTEWTNVTKAKPQFRNHYQPHLPADLGFYDLRLPEAREAQADLAKQYGIHGFCYYHYWFNGRRVLERPFEEVLASGKPDFPFCLCWANENWTRTWDGFDKQVLLKQVYSPEDDLLHIKYLLKAFEDERYIRVDNKPLFIVYKSDSLPHPKKTAEVWRDEAYKQGIGEIYLARMESYSNRVDPTIIGFDASIEFQPDWQNLPTQLFDNWINKVLHRLSIKASPYANNRIFKYDDVVKKMLEVEDPPYKLFPGITPMWDNSARKKQYAHMFIDSTPEKYGEWLRKIIAEFEPYSPTENLVFINAWNEWAEGNHLEPCQKWGRAYLEETYKVFRDV